MGFGPIERKRYWQRSSASVSCYQLQNLQNTFRWATDAGFGAFDDDGAFDQDGGVGHSLNQGRLVRHVFQILLLISALSLAHQVAGGVQAQLGDDLLNRYRIWWGFQIQNHIRRDAVLRHVTVTG